MPKGITRICKCGCSESKHLVLTGCGCCGKCKEFCDPLWTIYNF